MSQNNYRELTLSLKNRLDPDRIILEKAIKDELSTISYSDVVEYIRYAMNAVEPAYTQKSKDAGENVKSHLISGGLTNAEFKYQGSVMTNTHIRGHSDIDLLVISTKFYHYDYQAVRNVISEPAQQAYYYPTQLNKIRYEDELASYTGDSLDDLRKLRLNSETILRSKYLQCETGKPKSIKIKNTNLNREVDVVIANWYDDISSIISGKGNNRGIQVYNKELHARGKVDFPFISIDRINTRSSETEGRLKKMIRFMKNVKAKSDRTIDLSSFDFNAICYAIDVNKYKNLKFYQLVPVLFLHLYNLATNDQLANDLVSVDGREYIFRGQPQKLQSLKNIMYEITAIVTDLNAEKLT